ncbi:hypothetical protein DFA_09302 [Cavenderia fasciculata]|uniref:Copine-3 n=1 Tax=Cavenderia fasciculata TaxID=261658 RepID=F4Q790_CACFS|nr:uncharacterized protein DFA_09302 [Cavenderia fasciculata]EGG16272.1 hypothetical protein DFA_09302 [Cavenderia fasciculata]|eukprot:XP_004354656.1 hypothetical protein DFA_09302 [Cavenderia fasciculata]
MQTTKSRLYVELSFNCRNLANKDVLSKSDPQVLVYQNVGPDQWELVGQTEKIKNNLNPTFTKTVKVDYYFEFVQTLSFVVVDVDGDTKKAYKELSKHDTIGTANIALGQIVSAPGRRLEANLNTPAGSFSGMIDIRAEFFQKTGQKITFALSCKNLDKKDLFGKSDPYFKILRINEDNATWTEVYKSKVIMENLDPFFETAKFSTDELCGANFQRPIKFEFYDWDKNSAHDLIGTFTTTMEVLLSPAKDSGFPIINPKKTSKSGYKNSGVAFFNGLTVKTRFPHSILDYINGGCEIGLMVAIDCTASNSTGNLHRIDNNANATLGQGSFNQYEQSILEIGKVLAPYDTDNLIPIYGYGGAVNSVTSHCFPFDVQGGRLEGNGVFDLHQIYRQNIGKISLSYPTNFADVIERSLQTAQEGLLNPTHQKYTILLIITDGDISDMTETKNKLLTGSNLPLSVVIVGVGKGSDFKSMEELDGDKIKNNLFRDIVQFVPFEETVAKGNVAKETLKEIPKQFIKYMRQKNIMPNPPRQYIGPVSPAVHP